MFDDDGYYGALPFLANLNISMKYVLTPIEGNSHNSRNKQTNKPTQCNRSSKKNVTMYVSSSAQQLNATIIIQWSMLRSHFFLFEQGIAHTPLN